MKKNLLTVLICLAFFAGRAQNSTKHLALNVKDSADKVASDTTGKSGIQTYFKLIHNSEGYGYTVFKKYTGNKPQLNYDCYAVLWNQANDFKNATVANQPDDQLHFYNAGNPSQHKAGRMTPNQAAFLNFTGNSSSLDIPASLFNATTTNGGSLTLTPDNAVLSYTTTSSVSSALTMNNTQISIADPINTKGMTYASDYSTNGTSDPLWIPNWGAVQQFVTSGGGIYPTGGINSFFNNGIAPNTDTFGNTYLGLGGTLNQATSVDVNGNSLAFNDSPVGDYGLLSYAGGILSMNSPGTSGSGSNYTMYDGNIQLLAYGVTSPDVMNFNVGTESTYLTDYSGANNLSDNSVLLNLSSSSKGFLPPSMTTIQKNAIVSPAEGLTVYDLTLHALCYYNGTAWKTTITGDANGNIVTTSKVTTADGKDIFKTPSGNWKYIHVADDGSRVADSATVTIDSSGNATVTIP